VFLNAGQGYSPAYTGRRARVKLTRLFLAAAVGTAALAAPASAQEEPVGGAFVNRIVIKGNEGISSKDLMRRMRTKEPSFFAIFSKPRYSPSLLRRDIAALEAYYHSTGYFEAGVALDRLEYSADQRFVDIHIVVDEGRPTVVSSVRFSSNTLLEHKELRRGLLLSEGKPYNASLLATDVYAIKGKYYDRGYLAVSVQESVRVYDYRAEITYHVEPGTQVTVREIEVTGNALVKPSVIEKEFTFRRGDVCRFDKLQETKRNLFETGLFTVVDINPINLDPLERTVDVRVRVRERRPSYVEAGFGVGNVVGSRVSAEWGTRNLFGTGRTLRGKAEYGFDLFRSEGIDFDQLQVENIFWRYDVFFQQRRVFGTKLNFGAETFIERDRSVQDVSVRRIGVAVGALRRFGRLTEVTTDFSVEDIERQAFGGPVEASASHILGASASRDARDFVLNPRAGIYRIVRLQVAGGILGGKNDFYTASASFQWYDPLVQWAILAVRARVGFGDAYGRSPEVPFENRYFLGGGNSVRGYNENSLGPRATDELGREVVVGGEFLLLTNIEVRHSIPLLSRWNFSGAVFIDGGNVWESASSVSVENFRLAAAAEDVTVDDYRYTVGLGLRYNTPVGPIRLDYGVPIKRDTYNDNSGRFHLTLGQIF